MEEDLYQKRREWIEENYPNAEILFDGRGEFIRWEDEEGLYKVYLPVELQMNIP